MTILLTTERLRLRDFDRPDDAARLADLDSDPAVMRHLREDPDAPLPPTDELTARYRDEILPRWRALHDIAAWLGFWAAENVSDPATFIGWFHLRPAEAERTDVVEIGYRLKRAHWGRGLGTEGGSALIGRCFRDWGVAEIRASALVANVASRRVMEKLGMRERRRFTYGQDAPAVESALTREDYHQR